MKNKMLVYGEVIWDVYPEKKVIGGAPFNFAAHVSHLGDEAYFITATGCDELGEAAFDEMKKHGIKTDFVKKNSYPTGECTVTLDENKIPSYHVHTNAAYDNIEINNTDTEKINSLGADVFYFNTLIQRNGVSKKSLIKILDNCGFKHVFCDINIREGCYDYDSVRLCMEKATIVKISDEEAHFLYDLEIIEDDGSDFVTSVARRFKNIKTVILTKGKYGSCVLDTKSGVLYESGEPEKVKVVSTVGAGDCYGATFVSSFLSDGDISGAIKAATERSNIVVSSYEAVPF